MLTKDDKTRAKGVADVISTDIDRMLRTLTFNPYATKHGNMVKRLAATHIISHMQKIVQEDDGLNARRNLTRKTKEEA